MSKKHAAILTLLLALLLMWWPLCTAAYAEGTRVTYEGNSKKFVFLPERDDLFQGFKGVMPGDELSQDIFVSNNGENKVAVYLRAEVPEDGNKEFLNQMKLTVYGLDGEKIFEGQAGSTGSLTDGYTLGTIEPGEKGKLIAKLQVPAEMNNKYQQKLGKVSWIFSVEELEDIPDEPVPTTGDNTGNIIWVGLIGLAALSGIAVLVKYKIRINNK